MLDLRISYSLLRDADRPRALVVGGREPIDRARAPRQRRDRALVDDPPGSQDRDAVAKFFDLGEQVAGQQHRHPVVGEPPDQHPHVSHPGGVQPGRRLVEEQQLRRPQQRCRDPEALPHAVRIASDPIAGAIGQLDGLQGRVDPAAGVVTVEGGQQLEVAPRGHVGIEGRRLHEARDAVECPRGFVWIAPKQPDGPRRRPDQAEHHPQRRRLAGAVRSQIAVDVARLDRQVDPVDRRELSVTLDETADLDRRRGLRHGSDAATDSIVDGVTEPASR